MRRALALPAETQPDAAYRAMLEDGTSPGPGGGPAHPGAVRKAAAPLYWRRPTPIGPGQSGFPRMGLVVGN